MCGETAGQVKHGDFLKHDSIQTFSWKPFTQVRKAAVQLLTSLLESNPFAARLETEDLVKKLEEEEKKLAALCPEEVI